MDKEQIHSAYKRAIEDGYTQSAIAKKTGIGVTSLRNFLNDEILGPEYCKALEDWLAVRGFFNPHWANQDPFQLVAIELRSLFESLRSGIDDDIKKSRLIGFFDDWAAVVASFKDSQKGGS